MNLINKYFETMGNISFGSESTKIAMM